MRKSELKKSRTYRCCLKIIIESIKKGVASFGGEGVVFPPLLTGGRRPDEYGPVHGMGSLLSY